MVLSAMVFAQNPVRISLKQLPAHHPKGSPVYISGSFNGWNPGDERYKFRLEDDRYSIQLEMNNGSYEYKLTRGSWEQVECNADGTGITNRQLKVDGESNIELMVDGWQDQFLPIPKTKTAGPNVCVEDSAFYIPQLQRSRRIWICLPDDYCDGSNKTYPVLYMHDGQNVFDHSTSFSGEWGVDEFLDTSDKKVIVVAIDHGGEKRINEYNAFDHERFGKGEGSQYVDFLVKTLKPYIDKRFRTRKGKEHTFIAGSSMGGLISLYAVLKYPQVFGGVGVFSPAFWIAPSLLEEIRKKGKKVNSRIYFYAGKRESESMVPDMLKAMESLAAVSKSDISTLIRDEGTHNESTWRKEFPEVFRWISSSQ